MIVSIGACSLMLAGCGADSSESSRQGVSFEKRLVQASKETRPEVRAPMLMKIALGQAKAKDEFAAEDTMKLAAKACDEVDDPEARIRVLCLLSEAQNRLGNRSGARRAAESALAAAPEVVSPERQAFALARVGRARGVAGNLDGALETLAEAEQLAAGVEDLRGRTLVLVAVTTSYQKLDQPAQADRVVAAALQSAKTIKDHRQRCDAIAEVAARQHAMNKKEAVETFDLALQAAGEIENAFSHAYALANLAEKLSAAGEHTRTHEVLKEADAIAQKIPDAAIQRQMLDQIRGLMHELPEPSGAT